jgi:hypothetical protein
MFPRNPWNPWPFVFLPALSGDNKLLPPAIIPLIPVPAARYK